jgi:hypothetical protein
VALRALAVDMSGIIDALDSYGFDPDDERFAAIPPRTGHVRQPQVQPGQSRIGLFDMLLLGAPDGKTELINGRVRRVFHAATPEQARKAFARLARDLTEHHGLAWRRRLVEGRSEYEVERMRLSVEGRVVEL